MKKILSLVLAIMMVLSMASTAFAGTFEDVTDAATAKAVDALSSLGISNGYPDGTFKPEGSITRAEMVKLLVVALGHEDLASGAKSSFSDAQGKWFDGYAAVAQAIGITNGTGAGKFNGDSKITYSEVITMVLRALGYRDRSVNSNRQDVYNATAYKTTAARIGVLKNVTVGSGEANRGDVAKMVYNSLEVQIVDTNSDGNPVLQWILAPNPSTNTPGQARTLLDDVAKRDDSYVVGTADLFGAHPLDLSEYLGEKVIAYLNNDDEILFVKQSLDARDKYITKGSVAYGATLNGTKVNLKYSSTVTKTFDPANGVLIVNSVKRTDLNASDIITIINNDVHTAKFVAADSSTDKDTLVIEDVNYTNQVTDEYISGKTKFQGINLPLDKDKKVDTSKMVFVGAASSLEDIEINDVIQACVASNNVKFYVTRETIEGKVEEVNDIDEEYVINSEAYALNGTGNAITALTLGEEGIFFLDKDGDIAFAKAKTEVSNYGIITAYNPGKIGQSFGTTSVTSAPQVRMVSADGKSKVYDVAVGANKIGTTFNGFVVGGTNVDGGSITVTVAPAVASYIDGVGGGSATHTLVEYTLNADGKITSVRKANLSTTATGTKENAKFLADENTVILGRSFNSTDSTVSYSLVSLDKLTTGSIKYQVLTNSSSFKWDYVIIVDGINAASTSKTYAVIKGISTVKNSAGTTVQKITAFVDGVSTTYLTDINNLFADTDMDQVLALDFNSDGTVKGTVAVNSLTTALSVTASAIRSNTIRVMDVANPDADADGYVYHTLSKDVAVYKTASNGTISVVDLNELRVSIGGNTAVKVELYTKSTTDNVVDVIVIK